MKMDRKPRSKSIKWRELGLPVILALLTLMLGLIGEPMVLAQEAPKSPAPKQVDDVQLALNNGRLMLAQGRVDDAVNEFRRAAKLKDDKCAECFQMIGQVYFQFGRLKDAAVAYRQAAELKPAYEAELYNVLGVVLYLQNEKKTYDEAVEVLQRSIQLSKGKVVMAYYNLGFALIKSGKEEEGVGALKTYLQLDPQGNEASQARAVVANTKMVDARVAPTFAFKSNTGEDLSIEKLHGKIVLLEFWASWCGPCRAELPEIKNIWKKYSGDKFVIVGINLDSNRPAFEAFVKQEGLLWPQYYDGLGWSNKISQLYGVYAIPHSVLIDQDGVIKVRGLRGEELSNKIAELIQQVPRSASAH
jgi:tetratricopeptide (TPR) repeat protein